MTSRGQRSTKLTAAKICAVDADARVPDTYKVLPGHVIREIDAARRRPRKREERRWGSYTATGKTVNANLTWK